MKNDDGRSHLGKNAIAIISATAAAINRTDGLTLMDDQSARRAPSAENRDFVVTLRQSHLESVLPSLVESLTKDLRRETKRAA